MTLLFVDSFDLVATADLPLKYFAVSGGTVTTPGRFTPGNKFHSFASFTSSNTSQQPGVLTTYLSSPKVTTTIGFAMSVNSFATGTNPNNRILVLLDSAAGAQLQLFLDVSTGLLSVYRGLGVTLLCTSSTPITAGLWYYIELQSTIDPTTGSITLHQNGISVATFSGNTRQTANSNVQQSLLGCDGGLSIGNVNGASALYNVDFDDYYICDNAGSVNNTFLGDIRVAGILPSGAGTNTNLTIGGSSPAGTNFGSVNENPENGDVTYVTSNVVSTYDTYTYGSLPASASQILAVVSTPVARKDDAGARSLSTRIRSGGTEADSPTSAPLTTTYRIPEIIMELNPVTGIAWSVANVNAVQAGPKIAA